MKLITQKELISIENHNNLTTLENLLNEFSVSSKSFFRDDTWELNTKPNKINIIFRLNNKKLENKKLLLFWKLIIFLIISGMTNIKIRNKGIVSIFYNLKQLIVYLDEKKFLRHNGMIYFDNLYAKEYKNKIAEEKISSSSKNSKLRTILYWYRLTNYLPNDLKLPYYPFNKDIKSIFPYDETEKSWEPISYEEINLTVKEALNLMKYSNDIIKCIKEWRMFYGVNPKIKKFEAFDKYYDNSCGRGDGPRYKLAEIIYNMFDKKPDKKHPLEYFWRIAKLIFNNKIYYKDVDKILSKQYIRDLISALYGACLVIILISTGLRKSELYSLKRGCVSLNTMSDIPLLENESFKTNYGVNHIPIGNDGVNAISILEELAFAITGEKEGSLMFVVEKNGKKDINVMANMSTYAINKISKFYEFIGFEGEVPHLHQYRHTLSTAIWERTEQAPVLVQMLYHHTSLSMSMRYLRKNPILRQDRKKMMELTYKPLIKNIIGSISSDEIAGRAAKKLKNLHNFVKFEGKTENEILIDLEDLMSSMVMQDQMRIFLTPMCICVRSNNSVEKSPCMLMNESDEIYEGLPRTDRCVGSKCKDSLFTPIHKNIIEQSYQFYENILENLENIDNILMLNIAKAEHRKYKSIYNSINQKSMG
jgi:integrase